MNTSTTEMQGGISKSTIPSTSAISKSKIERNVSFDVSEKEGKIFDYIQQNWPKGDQVDRWFKNDNPPRLKNFTHADWESDQSPLWLEMSHRVDTAMNACVISDNVDYNKNFVMRRSILSFFPQFKMTNVDRKQYGLLPMKFQGGQTDIGRYLYRYYPYGLALNAYFKTGTQLMNMIDAEVTEIDTKYLMKKYYKTRLNLYSVRSIISKFNQIGSGTNKGIQFQDLRQFGLNSITAIVTRHPIYRIISSWNDKFSFNSTQPAGFNYGLRKLFLVPQWRYYFKQEHEMASRMERKLLVQRFKVKEVDLKKFKLKGGNENFPKDNGFDKWHLVEFERLVQFLAHFRGLVHDNHFTPYYLQSKKLSPCQLQYDVIIKQENFGQEFGYIAGKFYIYNHECLE